MGLTYHDVKRLWEARKIGHCFDDVLMVGRQQLFLHPKELDFLRRDLATHTGKPADALQGYRWGEYAERFCTEFLNTKTLQTLDNSSYEGATLVRDLNTPLEADLFSRFDAVIEAGCLEHIFQFPVAIRNLMMLTKPGGNIFLTTVANNFCGHGFYQFSPELIYRIFMPENGFEISNVILLEGTFPSFELTPARAAYRVVDPAAVHGRIILQNSNPVLMMMDAKKVRDVEPFRSVPQQSDYVTMWQEADLTAPPNGNAAKPRAARSGLLKRVFAALPSAWSLQIQGYREKRQFSFQNSRFYKKLGD